MKIIFKHQKFIINSFFLTYVKLLRILKKCKIIVFYNMKKIEHFNILKYCENSHVHFYLIKNKNDKNHIFNKLKKAQARRFDYL